MAPYPIDTPLDFNTDPGADIVADGPGSFRDTDPPRHDTEALLDVIGLSGQAVRELLSRTAAGGFGALE